MPARQVPHSRGNPAPVATHQQFRRDDGQTHHMSKVAVVCRRCKPPLPAYGRDPKCRFDSGRNPRAPAQWRSPGNAARLRASEVGAARPLAQELTENTFVCRQPSYQVNSKFELTDNNDRQSDDFGSLDRLCDASCFSRATSSGEIPRIVCCKCPWLHPTRSVQADPSHAVSRLPGGRQ
jgi:hypothetical protein